MRSTVQGAFFDFPILNLFMRLTAIGRKKMHKHHGPHAAEDDRRLSHSLLKLLPEQGNRSGHSDKVSHRLCQENGESLVRKKQRQYVNKRDQQDDFAQAGQKKRRLGIADGDKSLLTGNLHPHKEKHCRVNSESA